MFSTTHCQPAHGSSKKARLVYARQQVLEVTEGEADHMSVSSRQLALMHLASIAASKGDLDYAVDAYRNIIR